MAPVDLFYSYAHEDEALRDELSGHLKILERRGVIRSWHDRRINPGQAWDQKINEQLTAADLVLLLVSADFIKSDYIWGSELELAMQRHQRGEASVLPVLVRPCLIDDAPFASIQGLPTDLRAVTSWPNRDEAWTNVAIGIRKTVAEIQARKAALNVPPPSAQTDADEGSEHLSISFDTCDYVLLDTQKTTPHVAQSMPAWDPVLDRVVGEFVERTVDAAKSRGVAKVDRVSAAQSARRLIDTPRQARVLWVDDLPNNNRFETAALAKLQIQVVAVQTTDEAMATVAASTEPFDLVISDWSRPEPLAGATGAAVLLLRRLRAVGQTMPVICYHGGFPSEMRQQRLDLLMREGAFGETVLADELLAMVASALRAA